MVSNDLLRQFLPPAFEPDEALSVAQQLFGISGQAAALAGERDLNVRIDADDGEIYVLKISGLTENPDYVDLQAEVLDHIRGVDPGLCVPRGIRTRDGALYASYRFDNGDTHLVRLVSYLDGKPVSSVDPSMAYRIGSVQGRLCRALSSFFHAGAKTPMPWDTCNGLVFDEALWRFVDTALRRELEPRLEPLRQTALPALRQSRSQVIHNDLHTGNLLVDTQQQVCGIIDFGDMLFAPLIQDLAVSATSIADACPSSPFEPIGRLLQGFESEFPLAPEERELLHDATLLRSLLCVVLGSYKLQQDPGSVTQAAVLETSIGGLRALLNRPGRNRSRSDSAAVAERREKTLSPSYRLFYDTPLHIVEGRGVTLFDADGREYLDCYNNVPSVGHCHPHVVAALHRQASTLNTHTRYLHEEIVRYAERLTATLPAELDTCLFVCSGTEANDLAYQIARRVTGHTGAVVTEHVYHGNSIAVSALSPFSKQSDAAVRTIPVPDLYRGQFTPADADPGRRYAEQAADTIDALAASSHGLAMLMVDSIYDAPGIYQAPPNYLDALFRKVRSLGGLVVADEVQSGLCRLGDNFWGFMDSGVVPDLVTMGKPMGDGHPLAVVVAKRAILDRFAESSRYFNTFGGNPVSAAVGNAVLDVIENEALLQNVGDVGRFLKRGLGQLRERHPVIGDVRGKGFFQGIDLVSDRERKTPAPKLAHRLANDLRREGVLVAVTGAHDNVVKLRPPLVFRQQHAERLLAALDDGLGRLQD